MTEIKFGGYMSEIPQLELLKQIINNRTCGICASGQSIKELELYLPQLEEFNICWCGLSVFNIIEDGIFKPHNKYLDIVFDSSSIPKARWEHYETYWRVPRYEEFLNRNNNILITTNGCIRDSIRYIHREDILLKHHNKILEVDKIFPDHSWMDVPNSLTLNVGALIAGGAKKIILFGADGYTGDITIGVKSYYRAEAYEKDRLAALGSNQDAGINRDTNNFVKRFKTCYEAYCQLFNRTVDIYNCSPITLYEFPIKINYSKLRGILNESRNNNR
jgi:hypothetical protein